MDITYWNTQATRHLLGRKIIGVVYASDEQMADLGVNKRPLLIQLDNGILLWPASDDEGNDAGAIHGVGFKPDQSFTIPTL